MFSSITIALCLSWIIAPSGRIASPNFGNVAMACEDPVDFSNRGGQCTVASVEEGMPKCAKLGALYVSHCP
ncbi:hypothetical protein BCY86_02430 [Pajaroellobacter abortibovis]|uniref:Uncharacterized protein n=1 Tax=Pajaroellobacter abortibovis TaxID=1882918 RepID=A0A1L6MW44_9BACT|nr:hypothetical protein BCY86_02430 [Pajaroellobacter abortibovis]